MLSNSYSKMEQRAIFRLGLRIANFNLFNVPNKVELIDNFEVLVVKWALLLVRKRVDLIKVHLNDQINVLWI